MIMQAVEHDEAVEQIGQGASRTVGSRRPRGRRAARSNATPEGRKTLKLSLDSATIENLNLHAMKAGQSVSEFVREMVARHCTAWVIHAKPGPKHEA